MSRSTRRLYHVLEKAAWARTGTGNLAATAKIQEPPSSAVSVPSSKRIQDLSDGFKASQPAKWLHTSCKILLSDKMNSLAEGLNTEGASAPNDSKAESDTNADSSSSPPTARNPVSWLSFFLLLVTGAGLIFYYDLEKRQRIEAARRVVTEPKPGSAAGKAAIGGPFKLINHEGREITDKQFKGNWTLLYFGFTHCPDICPDELQKMVEAIDVIEKRDNLPITPVFISVDPERDSVEQIREYVKEFHPRLIGLTGSLDEIKQVARAYRVYYMKTEEEGLDYLVDHSIIMYLMDPKMEFVKFFGKNYDVNGLADGIITEIKNHKA
ncbi:hypothetical protein GOP47_0023735 [Adiantum capillus-veneris]|uniref:Thioredoxin domain-containing protein n=1 Tax=Adiantum capillus-veneris TaxID=13818 RepID=A0A9D4U533_ADICA|nr:hypothetical protein GOP47_0023735 [Adiantum capillus-veneris]